MAEPVYVTREIITESLDVKPTAYMAAQVDRACALGSRAAEGFCHRIFYPWYGTRTFDAPSPRSTSMRVWLDEHDLLELASVVSGGATIPASSGYLLYPTDGPPYSEVQIQRSGNYSFSGGPQNAIALTGLWGYSNSETLATTLAATATPSSIDVLRPVGGVGSILRIGTERMLLTDKRWIDSTITASALGAAASGVSITVADGSLFTELETLLIDSERMQVTEIAGNVLTVRRAYAGSTLAAHSAGAPIYWQHRLIVQRGALGTSSATALSGASVYRWDCPSPITSLSQAYAEDTFLQENAGYARTSGTGEGERPVIARGVVMLEKRVAHLKRSARSGAV